MTLIHLVRHAEVDNPRNIWYGRLPGFLLSQRGKRQSAALAEHFRDHRLAAVYSSPLDRAVETARPIAEAQGLEVTIDEGLIESETHLQGKPGDARLFRNPLNLRFFVNPFRPSWGESYRSIRDRLRALVRRMAEVHPGAEVVAVSHMTPIQVARLMFERNSTPPWRMGGPPCRRASVTTLEFDGDRFVKATYTDVGAHVK